MDTGPNVINTWHLEDMGITFNIKAFRIMGEDEMRKETLAFLAALPKNKRPKRGDTLTVITTIGSRD